MSFISLHDKLFRRAGHVALHHEGLVYIWGGFVEHIPKKPGLPNTSPKNCNDAHDSAEVVVYEPDSRSWSVKSTHGQVPPRTVFAAGCLCNGMLYVFGGHHLYESDIGYVEGNNNLLYRLDLASLRWRLVPPRPPSPGSAHPPPLPCEKTQLVCHRDRDLYTFGGYGEPPESLALYPLQPAFTADPWAPWAWQRGWNAHLAKFDVESSTWTWVETRGQRPSPRAGHSCVLLDDTMLVFGGREVSGRLNDLFALDLGSLVWTKLAAMDALPMPEPRWMHSLTVVNVDIAVLYAGIGQYCNLLADCWKLRRLNRYYWCWTEVELRYDHGQVRCCHSAVATADFELLVLGGLTQEHHLTRMQLDNHPEEIVSVAFFGPQSLRRLCIDKVVSLLERSQNPSLLHDLTLPPSLRSALEARLRETTDWCPQISPPPAQQSFSRQKLQAGM